MIQGITGGNHIVVNGNHNSLPYISSSNNPMQGALRIMSGSMQVFDGTSWISIGGAYPQIDLTGVANAAIDWAYKKMNEEAEWERLAKLHPTVKAALDEANNSFNKVRMVVTLCKEEKNA